MLTNVFDVYAAGDPALAEANLGELAPTTTARSIAKPINKVVDKVALITNGELHTAPLNIQAADETGKLASSINEMELSLRQIITDISEASYQLTLNSKNV
ncbi:MAG: HAMP domain-containing protein [Alkalibacterium thalassium]|nr:HAMP domain-containing protein [Alkalibacterium thalassium]